MQDSNLKPNSPAPGDFSNPLGGVGLSPSLIIKSPMGKRSKLIFQNGKSIILGEKEKTYLINLLRNGGSAYVWMNANFINGEYIFNKYLDFYWIRIKKLKNKGLIAIDKEKSQRGRPKTIAYLTPVGMIVATILDEIQTREKMRINQQFGIN
jgi:hypothetical protein